MEAEVSEDVAGAPIGAERQGAPSLPTRRGFLSLLPFFPLMLPRWGASLRAPINHPEPRPGIDASEVLTAERLASFSEDVRACYDLVREMPHIADGIGCSCGCSAMPGYRSLLTCYYPTGMAMGCAICQGQARLAHRRFKEGQTLEQIRRATDARFG